MASLERRIRLADEPKERRKILVEWVASHPDARLTPDVSMTLEQIRVIDGMSSTVNQMRRLLRERDRSQADALPVVRLAGDDEVQDLTGWLRGHGCPWVPDGMVVPFGYGVQGPAVGRPNPKDDTFRVVSHRPIAPIARAVDADTGGYGLVLAWEYCGRWIRSTLRRGAAMSQAGILTLADQGAPVHQQAATSCAAWLAAVDSSCDLPMRPALSRLGWLPDRTAFAWGVPIGAQMEVIPPPGAESVISGLTRSGTLDGWRERVWERCKGQPAEIVVLASLAAPLLHVVGAEGWTLDVGGPRGTGKSTSQRAAASVWGTTRAMMPKWPATWAAARSSAELRCDLPSIYDDTKNAMSAGWPMVQRMVYMVAGEQSQVLGSVGGTRAASVMRTILISSGESPISEHLQSAQGARYRLLPIHAPPFAPGQTDTVREVEAATAEEYGTAGPALVRWVMEHDQEWFKSTYRLYRDSLSKRDGSDDGGRIASRIALIYLAAVCAQHALGIEPDMGQIDEWAASVMREAKENDAPMEALRTVVAWAASRPSQFEGRVMDPALKTPVLGRWRDTSGVAIVPMELRAVLEQAGYDPVEIRKQWSTRGWLDAPDGRHTRSVRLCGHVASLVCITAEAWAIGGEDIDDESAVSYEPA